MLLFRDTKTAHAAISFHGAYLSHPNVGLLGSHGAIAVPLMATLLAWGRAGIAERIDRAMSLADELYTRLVQDERVIVYGRPASGVVLWRPRKGNAKSLRQSLPVETSSLTVIDEVDWLRHVAANPMADIEAIWEVIDYALSSYIAD